MKLEITAIQEARRESDTVMDKLFEDSEFRDVLRKKLREMEV